VIGYASGISKILYKLFPSWRHETIWKGKKKEEGILILHAVPNISSLLTNELQRILEKGKEGKKKGRSAAILSSLLSRSLFCALFNVIIWPGGREGKKKKKGGEGKGEEILMAAYSGVCLYLSSRRPLSMS